MKNKTMQNDKKSQPELQGVTKSQNNIKNRNLLRKKLKNLLEKQALPTVKSVPKANNHNTYSESSPTQSTSNKQPSEQKPQIVKNSKTKSSAKIKTETKNGQDQKKSPQPNISKKNKQIPTPNNSNPNDVSRKRKLKQKTESQKKINKQVKEQAQVLPPVKKQKLVNGKEQKINKPKQVKKMKNNVEPTKLKHEEPNKKTEVKNELTSEQKKLKKNQKKQSNEPIPVKKEIETKSKSKSEKKLKTSKYAQGRGPLRPPISDSELDGEIESNPSPNKKDLSKSDVSENDSSRESGKTPNNKEQALVRANNEFEDTGDINDYLLNSHFNSFGEDDESFEDEYEYEESEGDYSDEEDFDSEEGEEEYTDDDSADDYEEYSDDESYNSYSSNGDGSSDDEDDCYNFSEDYDDDTYEQPEEYPDDIYIAQGTAVKHDLTSDDIGFDSDSNSAQIIEIPPENLEPTNKTETETETTKTKTPLVLSSKEKKNKKSSSNEKIKNKNTSLSSSKENTNGEIDSDDSCPELVPIETTFDSDNDDYETYDSSHSCYSDCSCDSMGDESFDDYSPEQSYEPMTPEIIKAKVEVAQEIEKMLDFETNFENKEALNDLLRDIENPNTNPMNFTVYTINNEVLDNDSLLSLKTSRKAPSTMLGNKGIKQNERSAFTKVPSKAAPSPSTSTSHEKPRKLSSTANNSIQVQIQNNIANEDHHASQSSANENETILEENPKKNAKEPKTKIRSLFFNAINCNHVIVLLKDPLYIYGTLQLKLLGGSMDVFGYNPKRNEVLEIFSPRGYSSLKIEPTKSPADSAGAVSETEILSLTPFFIRSDLEEVLANYDPSNDAILILERNDRSKKVNMLRKYMAENLFPNMNSILSDRPFHTSEFLLRCILTPQTDNPLIINPDWNHIPVQNNSKIMVIGGKSVGKSTLVRYLINKNLNKHPKILLIDLDIGQPEMFVPQTISATTITQPLLGPGYFLNKQPDKSFLIGDINIVQSVETYIECLKALSKFCNENKEYNNIPWVINTMGYNKGFGDELVSVICSLFKPSNIVQFDSQREINNFDVVMMKDNVKSIERHMVGEMFKAGSSVDFNPQHQLTLINALTLPHKSQKTNECTMKPREMRLAMILSRLSDTITGHAEWLTDVKPLCASIDDLHIIKMGEDQMDKEELIKTLVGNIFYLCRLESGKALECFGIGTVRGIDYPLRQIYLLPSVSHCFLENVNCLAVCGIPLPSSIILNQGPKVKGIASYVYNTLDEASSMYVKQMFNKPKPYRKMKSES